MQESDCSAIYPTNISINTILSTSKKISIANSFYIFCICEPQMAKLRFCSAVILVENVDEM